MKARVTDLQSLMTVVSTIQDAAKRVWEKMGQVKEKKAKLKYQCTCSERSALCVFHVCFFFFALTLDMFTYWILPVMGNVDDPRDLKTVEKDLAKSSDQKEAAYTDINKLNNEQKDLNEKISRTTNQAATAERNAREKEDAFKRDQESTKRKDELNDELKRLAEQEKEFDKQVRRHCHLLGIFPTIFSENFKLMR
jgi:hypothetical protein